MHPLHPQFRRSNIVERKMKIAVVGAKGQIGRELAFLLQRANMPNLLLAREPIVASFLQHKSSTIIAFDFNNLQTFEPALKDVDRLFLVCDSSVREEAIRSFLNAAKKVDIKKIVVISGIGADKNKTHFLAKLETLVEESQIPYVALRANWFFQNFSSHFKEMITPQHELIFPDGRASISFVDARDIAEVSFYFLSNELAASGIGYEITGPESLSHESVAQLFSKYLPYHVGYKEVSEKEAMEQLGWDEEMLSLFRDIRNGITSSISPIVTKILGKSSRRLEDYIKENLSLWN
jgi:uncharacterized protein YbjT (DUF2867 family)